MKWDLGRRKVEETNSNITTIETELKIKQRTSSSFQVQVLSGREEGNEKPLKTTCKHFRFVFSMISYQNIALKK